MGNDSLDCRMTLNSRARGALRRLETETASSEPFRRTLKLIDATLAEGVIPGVAVGAWFRDRPEALAAFARGAARLKPIREPLTLEHRFDLASLTKVLATAPLVAALVDR